ncbi:MAG: hypothetical protein MZV64_17220 [Ignavibacteriales bacterium]|nr:hypothetical protein [Ignavibacteriales bacterium]
MSMSWVRTRLTTQSDPDGTFTNALVLHNGHHALIGGNRLSVRTARDARPVRPCGLRVRH